MDAFLASMYDLNETFTKTASAAAPDELTPGAREILDAALENMEKIAEDILTTDGKQVNLEKLSEEQFNGLLEVAVDNEIEKRALAAAEPAPDEDEVATALDTVKMASDFGEFMATKKYKEDHGFLAKVASILDQAEPIEDKVRARVVDLVKSAGPAGKVANIAATAVKKTPFKPSKWVGDVQHLLKGKAGVPLRTAAYGLGIGIPAIAALKMAKD